MAGRCGRDSAAARRRAGGGELRVAPNDPALAYLQARAASMSGDHARSAALLASLSQAEPNQVDIARKALSEAVAAGQMDLALQPARAKFRRRG